MCTSQAFVQGETVRTNYCHANGVKKQSSNLSTDQGYSTSMRVSGRDGAHCYTLEMHGTAENDLEDMVWRSPTGAVLLNATWSKSADRLRLLCAGQIFEPRDIGCPGLDGEPGPADCTPGACPD